MYISKSLLNIKNKKGNVNLEKDKYYITYLDLNDKNLVHSKIPQNKIYKKGYDLTNKKIFINTSFALGDSVHLIPVLKALKQYYKGIYIAVEHSEENKILENTPYIDELVKRPVDISIIDKFDYIVDITTHVATVGFDNRFVPDYLASIFGIGLLDKKPDINLSKNPDVITNINKIKRYISLGKPLLGIHFESSSIHRRIPSDVLDIILNYAKDKYTIVCAYTESGKELANEYFEKYPFIIDVSNYVKDVEHLINYVGILDILISAETSVGHIGAGLGKPTLVIMGASSYEDVYNYNLPYIKGVNARYVGVKCSSPCRIHALNTPCPEAVYKKSQKLQEDDYSPCFKYIDKIELLNTFKSLEAYIENKEFKLDNHFEDRFFYYYTSNLIGNYIGRYYEYFNRYRHTILYFIKAFSENKSLKLIGYDKILYEEFLKENNINIDEKSDNIIITDGFYNNIDFKSLKDKKALILFANKNRLYNLVKRGYDIFDLGVVKRKINEYTKNELEDILSKYFKNFHVFETPISYKEYELIYGSSNSQENIPAHNAFMRASINSYQGAFLVAVINDSINLENSLDVYTYMHYEYITANKYKDISLFTKSSKDEFDIIELKSGKKLNVFLAFEKEDLCNFYNTLKDLDIGIYTAFIKEYTDDVIQTLSNINIDIVFTDFKSLKTKIKLPYITNKIIFIDRDTTLEDLKIYFEDEKNFEEEFYNILSYFPINKTIFLSVDDRIVDLLNKSQYNAKHFYGYYTNLYNPDFNLKQSIIFLSDASIHKTYSNNTITEFFIKKLSNFRTSLKALKEDIKEYELRDYFYDYQYMGAYACKYNNSFIKHIGFMDFSDEILFRVSLSTIENTRDFPDTIIYKHQLKCILNPKNIVIGFSDILSNTLPKYLFDAFNNKTLFITDYKKPLEDIFGKYGEYISGYSIEDLVEKANYFKENKDEAKEIISYIKSQIKDFSLKNMLKGFI